MPEILLADRLASVSATTATDFSFIFIGLLSIALAFVIYIIYEQLYYLYYGSSLPGPGLVPPIIGSIIAVVRSPFNFWHSQFSLGPLSWNAIAGKFFVLTTTAEECRRIFERCSEDLSIILHPNAYRILGVNNIAFMNGSIHKEARYRLTPLFSPRALSVYLQLQVNAIRAHLQKWYQLAADCESVGQPIEMRPLIYELNTQTSISVFIGNYLSDNERKEFQRDYTAVTKGFLSFPLYFPGTGLWNAVRARERIVANLEKVAARAKAAMSENGAQPKCLLDFWMVNTIKEIDENNAKGLPAPPHSSNHEIACLVLDFLFASQDASTSSLTWCVHLMCEYPEILAKVREEQKLKRPNHEPFDSDGLASMTYSWQVTKEMLRYRPPVTIVPHLAAKDYKLIDYTAPAGSMIIPSVWNSNRTGFQNPDMFDPDRFNAERQEHIKYQQNFLSFGAGPHYCLGVRYAMNHLQTFLCILADECDFSRFQNAKVNNITYLPTIYPEDGCLLTSLKPRK